MEKQAWIQHLKSLEKNAIIAATGRAAHPCAQLHSKIGGIPDLPPDFVWPYFENVRGWESVSYTHLDVYKRQIQIIQKSMKIFS